VILCGGGEVLSKDKDHSWKRFLERERERGKRGSRGKRLRREITLESNFRVNLIWVGWVNFNLSGFFLIWIGLTFFGLGYF
jgi:hypothetical protein